MKIILSILGIIWKLLRWLLIPAAGVVVFMLIRITISVLWARHKGMRRPDGEHNHVKQPGFFYRIFIQFPRQFARDFFTRPVDWFKYQGVIVFTGRQGSGKTVAMVEQTLRMQYEYPSCKCIGNLAYVHQDDELVDWRQLVDYKNGHQGVIVQMDEMQNWFSSNQSKNFPPELLEIITQNRKNRRVILGTSQVFNRLSKPLREQTTEVRKCITLFGCLTIVHRVEPELDSQGEVLKWKHRGFYWFVHTPEIRDSYDTYHVIESLANSGFQDPLGQTTISVIAPPQKKIAKR